MECSICLNNWDAKLHIPRLLACGHTFCQSCLVLMLEQKGQVVCSLCMQTYSFKKESEIQALIKNFMLLQAVSSGDSSQDAKGKQKAQADLLRTSIMLDIKEENPDMAPPPRSVPEEQKQKFPPQEEVKVVMEKPPQVPKPKPKPPKLVIFQRCSYHNMLIHSWNPNNQQVMCTQCIQEANRARSKKEPPLSYQVLPSVVSEIRRRVQATREVVKLRRLEVKKIGNYLKDVSQKSPITAKEALAIQLSNLQELIGNVHKLLADKMTGQIDRQSQTIKGLKSQIDKAKQEFSNHEIVLNDINSHQDNEIVYFTDLLEEVSRKANGYDIDSVFNFDNLGITVQTNQQMFNQVGSFITQSIVVKPTHQTFRSQPAYPSLVIREDPDNWICLRCYQVMHGSTIFCQQCQRFRDISTMPHILYNPYKVSRWEVKYLKERREVEKKMVVERDQQDCEGSRIWYFISAQWLSEWKMFVLNKESKDFPPRLSPNREIGVLPPGPVSNLNLLREGENMKDPTSFKIRAGLQKLVDYRGVNEKVWNLFVMLYGGGPCIWGKTYDIYDGARPLIKKQDKILEQQRIAGRIKGDKPKLQSLNSMKERKRSQQLIEAPHFKMSGSEIARKGPVDDIMLPPEAEKPSSQRNIFNRQERSNLRGKPSKQRGQSANISPMRQHSSNMKMIRVQKGYQERQSHFMSNKKPSTHLIERSNYEAGGERLRDKSEQFDEGNLNEDDFDEEKRGTTLKKFVGLMRNIFNKD